MSPLGKRLRAKAKGERQRHAAIVGEVVRILDCGRSSKFEYEASCRHGLRAGLCLEGKAWSAADKFAGDVVSEALRRLGAERPSWWQGQPEYADTDTSRGWCAREGCGRPIPIEAGSTNGTAVKYCSKLCSENAHAERQREHGARMDLASYLAQQAARSRATMEARARHCEHCGRHFLSRKADRKYCSHACFTKAQTVHSERPCAACGKPFKPKNCGPEKGVTRYCSKDCAAADRRKQREARTCAHCGAAFTPKFPSDRKKFCSPACGNEAAKRKLTCVEC